MSKLFDFNNIYMLKLAMVIKTIIAQCFIVVVKDGSLFDYALGCKLPSLGIIFEAGGKR